MAFANIRKDDFMGLHCVSFPFARSPGPTVSNAELSLSSDGHETHCLTPHPHLQTELPCPGSMGH